MRQEQNSSEREARRLPVALAALSLSLVLAAASCTTDRTPGNGQPSHEPSLGPAAPQSPPGTESGATTTSQSSLEVISNSSMASSSSITPMSRADAAAAVLRRDSAYGGVVLGAVDPGNRSAAANYAPSRPTGQFIPPSATANPEITVNSSISSPATTVITSGGEDGALFTDASGAVEVAQTGSAAPVLTGGVNGVTSSIVVGGTVVSPPLNTGTNVTLAAPAAAPGAVPVVVGAGASGGAPVVTNYSNAVTPTNASIQTAPTDSTQLVATPTFSPVTVTPATNTTPPVAVTSASAGAGTVATMSVQSPTQARSAMATTTTASRVAPAATSSVRRTASASTPATRNAVATSTARKRTAVSSTPIRVATDSNGNPAITNVPASKP